MSEKNFAESAVFGEKNFADSLKYAKLLYFFVESKIVPIEVKSSGYKTHKSLDLFCEKFSSRIGEKILLYTKDYQKEGEVQCISAYFAWLL